MQRVWLYGWDAEGCTCKRPNKRVRGIERNTYRNSKFSELVSEAINFFVSLPSFKITEITTHQRRFDQNAIYFVKSTQEYKIGVYVDDLTPEQRSEIERNNGALITVVIEDSPAFSSNILAGDVLIAVDGKTVKDADRAKRLMDNVPETNDYSVLTVIRNGEEKDIRVDF